MKPMKTLKVGVVFNSMTSEESISLRLLQGNEGRQEFFEKKSTPTPALEQICDRLGNELGGRVKARWSERAGCSMCPCSPGFELVLEVNDTNRKSDRVFRLANTRGKLDKYVFWVDGVTIKTVRYLGEKLENWGTSDAL